MVGGTHYPTSHRALWVCGDGHGGSRVGCRSASEQAGWKRRRPARLPRQPLCVICAITFDACDPNAPCARIATILRSLVLAGEHVGSVAAHANEPRIQAAPGIGPSYVPRRFILRARSVSRHSDLFSLMSFHRGCAGDAPGLVAPALNIRCRGRHWRCRHRDMLLTAWIVCSCAGPGAEHVFLCFFLGSLIRCSRLGFLFRPLFYLFFLSFPPTPGPLTLRDAGSLPWCTLPFAAI
ncbi:hypothetical protein C8R46DRAFT_282912 [Mycena filopes]|nr:hypothetical protein C8R46DRAFT_282912 [Mycena filopes]